MKFLKNKNQYIIYLVIFLILCVSSYFSYSSLVNRQYKAYAQFLEKHAQSFSKKINNDLSSFIIDIRYLSSFESLENYLNDDNYDLSTVEKLKTFYEKYSELITGIQIYNDIDSRSFIRAEGNYYRIQPVIDSKRKCVFIPTLEYYNNQIYYIVPVRNNKGEIKANMLLEINITDFLEKQLADHYIAPSSWAFLLNQQTQIIKVLNSDQFIEPSLVSREDLSVVSARLLSGLQGEFFTPIKIGKKKLSLVSGYYPIKIFDDYYGIIFSLPKSMIRYPMIQVIFFYGLIILFIFAIFIHAYRVFSVRVKIARLEAIRFENSIAALIDNLPVGIMVFNDENKVLSVNSAMFTQLEISRTEISRTKGFDLEKYPELQNLLSEDNRSFGTLKKIRLMHNGNEQWFLKSIIPIQLKNIDYLLILVNISEQELNIQNFRESNRMKDEFLSNMSHEFRTPLNSILGFTNLISKKANDPESQIFTDNIRKSANQLLSMFEEIMHLVKLESNEFKLDPVPFDLFLLLRDINKKYQIEAERKNLLYKTELASEYPLFNADSFKIRIMLENLISNAIKFTHQGSVVFSAEPIEIDNEFFRIKFTISDTGIGIPQTKWDKIFEPFIQADGSKTRTYSGAGIGLTIANKIAHIFDSSIKIEKSDHTGSVFSVIILLNVLKKSDD